MDQDLRALLRELEADPSETTAIRLAAASLRSEAGPPFRKALRYLCEASRWDSTSLDTKQRLGELLSLRSGQLAFSRVERFELGDESHEVLVFSELEDPEWADRQARIEAAQRDAMPPGFTPDMGMARGFLGMFLGGPLPPEFMNLPGAEDQLERIREAQSQLPPEAREALEHFVAHGPSPPPPPHDPLVPEGVVEWILIPGGRVELGWGGDLGRALGVPAYPEADQATIQWLSQQLAPAREVELEPFLIERSPRRAGADFLPEGDPLYETAEAHAALVQALAQEGCRLPSPDEWEHACATGSRELFRWGGLPPVSVRSDAFTSQHEPNAFGLEYRYPRNAWPTPELTNVANLYVGGDGGDLLASLRVVVRVGPGREQLSLGGRRGSVLRRQPRPPSPRPQPAGAARELSRARRALSDPLARFASLRKRR